jgi:hypothetical protein
LSAGSRPLLPGRAASSNHHARHDLRRPCCRDRSSERSVRRHHWRSACHWQSACLGRRALIADDRGPEGLTPHNHRMHRSCGARRQASIERQHHWRSPVMRDGGCKSSLLHRFQLRGKPRTVYKKLRAHKQEQDRWSCRHNSSLPGLPYENRSLLTRRRYLPHTRKTRGHTFSCLAAPSHLATTHAYIEHCLSTWNATTEYCYVLTEHAQARLVGMISVRVRDWSASLGYVLARSPWGQGIMPEAAQAVSDYILEQPAMYRVWAVYWPTLSRQRFRSFSVQFCPFISA